MRAQSPFDDSPFRSVQPQRQTVVQQQVPGDVLAQAVLGISCTRSIAFTMMSAQQLPDAGRGHRPIYLSTLTAATVIVVLVATHGDSQGPPHTKDSWDAKMPPPMKRFFHAAKDARTLIVDDWNSEYGGPPVDLACSGCHFLTLPAGWGTNPSIQRPPPSLLAVLRRVSPAAMYIGVMRMDRGNDAPCDNPSLTELEALAFNPFRDIRVMSAIVVLDGRFGILNRMPLGPIHGINPFDARLLVVGNAILLSFSGISTLTGERTGFYLAQLQLINYEFKFVSLRLLTSDRNAGLLVANDTLWELNTIIPPHVFSIGGPPRDVIQPYHMRPQSIDPRVWSADWFASNMNESFANHNSINPLLVPELGGVLALSHRHYKFGTQNFTYGADYRYIFHVLDERSLRIIRHSREFTIPAVGGKKPGIQFVTGVMRMRRSILLAYGVDDCTSAIAILPIDFIKNSLLELEPRYSADSGPVTSGYAHVGDHREVGGVVPNFAQPPRAKPPEYPDTYPTGARDAPEPSQGEKILARHAWWNKEARPWVGIEGKHGERVSVTPGG